MCDVPGACLAAACTPQLTLGKCTAHQTLLTPCSRRRFWNTVNGTALNCIDTGSQVCNLVWSKNVNEIVSTHGYSQNQVVVWKYPSLTKMASVTLAWECVWAVCPMGQSKQSAQTYTLSPVTCKSAPSVWIPADVYMLLGMGPVPLSRGLLDILTGRKGRGAALGCLVTSQLYPACLPQATLTGHSLRALYLAASADGRTVTTPLSPACPP